MMNKRRPSPSSYWRQTTPKGPSDSEAEYSDPEALAQQVYRSPRKNVEAKSGTLLSGFGLGFNNLGNTCYLNSTTQVLIHIKALGQFFSTHGPENCE